MTVSASAVPGGPALTLRRLGARLRGGAPRPRGWWVPVLLAAAAVLSQIVYPLVSGSARDANTIVTVLLFSAASLSHAAIHRGARAAAAVAGVFAGGGLLVEVVGVATGFPFGSYAYSDRIGPMVGDVPLIIPLAWSMLGYPALVVARWITTRPWPGILVAAGALATWDLYLDPQMVAEGYWTWGGGGPALIGTIPVTNYLAWLGTAGVMMAVLWLLTRGWAPVGSGPEQPDDRVPIALYVWTWAGSLVAHAAFFGLPQSALYGGIGMGLFVLLLVRARSLAQADPATDSRSAHRGESAIL